jgi:RNA polymerase sigma-70 factor (ECF subfamily)
MPATYVLPPALGREQQPQAARAVVGVMRSVDANMREAVGQHLDLVWRVLRRGGLSAVDAEDASQDVFWILAQRFDAVPRRAQKAFLVSTALRVAADRRRSKWHRSVDTGLELDEHECPTLAADQQLDLRRAAQLLDRALATLAQGDRDIYILAELEQLSRSEVAEALTLPKGTVASRLRRAREAFETALRRLHRGGRP